MMKVFISVALLLPLVAATTPALNADEVCPLPAETGPCKGTFKRFFYNTSSGSCEEFTYGGCQGNRNNFQMIEECQVLCEPSTVSKRHAVSDNVVVAENESPCSLPMKVGICRASIPRFYFNTESGKCEEFSYGGCLGNANNFETVEDCNAVCSVVDRKLDDQEDEEFNAAVHCHMPAEPGMCMAYMPRFAFSPEDNKCVQFIYGGCGGNKNRFFSKDDCTFACFSEIKNVSPKFNVKH